MIEYPPKVTENELVKAYFMLASNNNDELSQLIERINENYEYWSDVKYKKLPSSFSHEMLWTCVKASRLKNRILVWKQYGINVSITNQMQRVCHELDMNFGGSWGNNSLIPEENKNQYLISSLMEEAIFSSQMEGASTTRKVAKEMLKKKITPKDKSQQMIFNNYQTINFIVENKEKPLTKELLLKIHSLMTNGTMENAEDAGRFRLNNDVVVEDGITHEVVHIPPSYTEIPHFIEDLCTFFNEDRAKIFIHPIIRGIIIHFMLAYMHPFVDGNGRTARALFYWYMLKQGYWLTEYLSISRIIARSKKTYEKTYLFAEADGNDIGYFVAYNLRVLELAFQDLQHYICRKISRKKQADIFLRIGNINERQAEIIRIYYENPKEVMTVKDVQVKFGVTPTTAKTDIVGLLKIGILAEIPFNKVKKGYIKGDNFDELTKNLL